MWVKAQSQTTVHSTHYFSFTMMIVITINFFILYSVPVYDSKAVLTDSLFLCINFTVLAMIKYLACGEPLPEEKNLLVYL